MLSLIEGFVAKGDKIVDLKNRVKDGKKEAERLEDVIDKHEDVVNGLKRLARKERTYFNREMEDERDDSARAITKVRTEVEDKVEKVEKKAAKEIAEVKDEMAVVKRDSARDVARAEDEGENNVRRIKEESASRIEIIEEENAAEVKAVTLNAQTVADNAYCNDIEDLKDRLATAQSNEAGAIASADEKDTIIKSFEADTARHDELIRFVLTKLPNVDLSKFNINVEVPTPEVTVISAGGKGGNQKKEK